MIISNEGYGPALKLHFKMLWMWMSDFYMPLLLTDAYTSEFSHPWVVCIGSHFSLGEKVIFCIHGLPRRLLWWLKGAVVQDTEEAYTFFSDSKSNSTLGRITTENVLWLSLHRCLPFLAVILGSHYQQEPEVWFSFDPQF